MDDYTRRSKPRSRRRSWCCSFTVPPSSPEGPSSFSRSRSRSHSHSHRKPLSKPSANSVPNSPLSSKSGLSIVGRTRIDPRRILSPGRVSPIDSDPVQDIQPEPIVAVDSIPESKSQSFRAPPESSSSSSRRTCDKNGDGDGDCDDDGVVFDVRLNLRGKNGGFLVLELNSEVLSANSEVFASLISEYKTNVGRGSCSGSKMCRIEVPEVEKLGVFRETIELMFENYIEKCLLKIGVHVSLH